MGRCHAVQDTRDRLACLLAHLVPVGPHGAAELGRLRNDVVRGASRDAGDGDDDPLHRRGVARGDVLQVADRLRRDRDRIDRLVREGGMAPTSMDPRRERVDRGGAGAVEDGDLSHVEGRDPVSAENGLNAIERAGGHKLGRTARRHLLGMLEEKSKLPFSSARCATSKRAAASSIAVCPSCPQACITPSLSEAKSTPLSSWMERASMSARRASVGPGCSPRNRATTLVGVGQSNSSPPNEPRVSRTKRAVSCSQNESSG
jgi:hypothetical protein